MVLTLNWDVSNVRHTMIVACARFMYHTGLSTLDSFSNEIGLVDHLLCWFSSTGAGHCGAGFSFITICTGLAVDSSGFSLLPADSVSESVSDALRSFRFLFLRWTTVTDRATAPRMKVSVPRTATAMAAGFTAPHPSMTTSCSAAVASNVLLPWAT